MEMEGNVLEAEYWVPEMADPPWLVVHHINDVIGTAHF